MHSSDRTLLSKLGFSDQDKKERRHDWGCQYLAQPEVAGKLTRFLKAPSTYEIWVDQDVAWQFKGYETEVHVTKGEGKYKTTIGFLDTVLRYELKGRACWNCEWNRHLSAEWSRLNWGQPEGFEKLEYTHGDYRPPGDTRPAREAGWGYWIVSEIEKDVLGYPKKAWVPVPIGDPPKIEDKLQVQTDQGVLIREIQAWNGPEFREGKGWCVQHTKWTQYGNREHAARILVEVKIHPVTVGDILRQLNLYREFEEGTGTWSAVLVATAFDLTENDVDTLRRAGVEHVKLGAGFEAFCKQMASTDQAAHSLEL